MNGSDLTTVITLEGPKASMVKMLNAGILSLGRTNLINEGEDKETIKQKVTGDAIVFQFQDLLNGSGEPLPRERIPLDEDGQDYYEDFGFKVAEIAETEEGLIVVLYYWSRDGYTAYNTYSSRQYPEFLSNLVGLYHCRADFVTGGEEFPKYAASFRLENAGKGDVTQTHFEPWAEYRGYQMAFDRLSKLDPELFLQFEKKSLEHLIDNLKDDLEYIESRFQQVPDETAGDEGLPF